MDSHLQEELQARRYSRNEEYQLRGLVFLNGSHLIFGSRGRVNEIDTFIDVKRIKLETMAVYGTDIAGSDLPVCQAAGLINKVQQAGRRQYGFRLDDGRLFTKRCPQADTRRCPQFDTMSGTAETVTSQ